MAPGRWLRLHEKGGKEHEMPLHHLLEETLDEYIPAAGIFPLVFGFVPICSDAPLESPSFITSIAYRLTRTPRNALSQMDRSEEAAYDIVLNVAYYGTLKYRSDVERRSGVKVSTSGGSAR
jgi:hypothetical protein